MRLSRDEFQRLAMEQLDTLHRVARRLTGDAGSAEDLVQETFVRALRASGSFDLQQFGIRPWLVRIMHNLHSSRAGRESRAPRAMDTERLDASSGKNDGTLPPINPASFDAMDEKLVGALESLPSEYQSVLLLWAVEEFSYKEIAEAMDIPIGTVMSRLHRSRQKLSDLLGGAAPDGERT
ncbi:MAG: sigma-70 family RNA polymerase sigma factor [Tepidisphaeraceae bacterium]|jgi:RNA polymerase sigma-70 factor (ECF subfamily)